MLKDLCFEIIETCPNNCKFCSSVSNPNKIRKIDFETFKKVIDHIINLGGIKEVSLSGGEPLLHPNIFDMIKYLKDKNIDVVLFTSGIKKNDTLESDLIKELNEIYKNMPHKEMLIKKELELYKQNKYRSISKEEVLKLKELGLDKIVFDFQALNEDIYNEIMGTKNYLTYIIKSIIYCINNNINTDAHYIPTKLNYKELPDIIEALNIAEVQNLSILNFVPQGRGKINEDILKLNKEEMEEFINIFNTNKDKFKGNIRVGIPLIKDDNHLCTAGLDKLVIKYDGTVLPCPAFKEYDLNILNKIGINTPNIYTDLDKLTIKNGTRKKPLCKALYNMHNYIK